MLHSFCRPFPPDAFAHEDELIFFNLLHNNHVYSAGKTWHFRFKFPTHPGKVQIPHPRVALLWEIPYSLGTDDSQMPMGCPGEGDVEASNWSAHKNAVRHGRENDFAVRIKGRSFTEK